MSIQRGGEGGYDTNINKYLTYPRALISNGRYISETRYYPLLGPQFSRLKPLTQKKVEEKSLGFPVSVLLDHYIHSFFTLFVSSALVMAAVQVSLPLPVLPEGWSAEKDFKRVGTLSSATQRNLEPVGPHFLAHARRVCH